MSDVNVIRNLFNESNDPVDAFIFGIFEAKPAIRFFLSTMIKDRFLIKIIESSRILLLFLTLGYYKTYFQTERVSEFIRKVHIKLLRSVESYFRHRSYINSTCKELCIQNAFKSNQVNFIQLILIQLRMQSKSNT